MSDPQMCHNCRHFEVGDDSGAECHRFPPQVILDHTDTTRLDCDSRWPQVYGDDWCGEWKGIEDDD
jgi:hypothetical protein